MRGHRATRSRPIPAATALCRVGTTVALAAGMTTTHSRALRFLRSTSLGLLVAAASVLGVACSDAVTSDEVEEFCENIASCWDDAEPCTTYYAEMTEDACQDESRALVDCASDEGTFEVCEGDGVPCKAELDAYKNCRP